MIHLDEIEGVGEIQHYDTWRQIPDHLYIILLLEGVRWIAFTRHVILSDRVIFKNNNNDDNNNDNNNNSTNNKLL